MIRACPSCKHPLKAWEQSLKVDGYGRHFYECPKCREKLRNRFHPGELAFVLTVMAAVFTGISPRFGYSSNEALWYAALVAAIGGIVTAGLWFAFRRQTRFRVMQWDD